jgi:hypothetical protein
LELGHTLSGNFASARRGSSSAGCRREASVGCRREVGSSHPRAAGSSSSSVDISSISIPSTPQHAMSWIFNTQAEPGTNPWKWEWGSPASFAGRRSCGCLRCQVCSCHKPRTSAPPAASAHDDDNRSAPPAASAHDDDNRAGILRPTFLSGAQYPKARIEHGRAGDDILWRYYRKHGTFAGALVYIKPNVCNDPAASAQCLLQTRYPLDLPMPTKCFLCGPIPESTD